MIRIRIENWLKFYGMGLIHTLPFTVIFNVCTTVYATRSKYK